MIEVECTRILLSGLKKNIRNFIIGAIFVASERALFAAVILGIISPKIRRRDVTIITLIMNAHNGFTSRLNISDIIYVENIVIVTFTKLLNIRIVARNCLGLFLISRTNFSAWLSEFSISLISLGRREKNAVSLPEAIADNNRSIIKIMRQIAEVHDNPMKKGVSAERSIMSRKHIIRTGGHLHRRLN